ncbi:sugar-binding protein [Shewanella algae]|uniref:RHS repeat domain-containing protein n=1 Tax=Shewanella algae TaxID=38313 RepID=UPI001F44EAE9|nr:sugar-binding protein [Shewanella algae]MCE9773599.1 sugar-binding protein [Shewanella algae]
MNKFSTLALSAIVSTLPVLSFASELSPYADRVGVDVLDNLNVTQDLATYTTDLFGDAIDPSFGSIKFSQVDVDIPGNSQLPVQIVRVLSSPDGWFNDTREFASWSLELPHIRTSIVRGPNAIHRGGWSTGTACSSPINPADIDFGEYHLSGDDYWGGETISIPGIGIEKILVNTAREKVTLKRWKIQCFNSPNGYEGFKITDDKGNKYTFDKLKLVQHDKVIQVHPRSSSMTCDDVVIMCEGPTLPGGGTGSGVAILYKVSTFMLPSRIEDKYGNWVAYEYTGDNLTKIHANDGRSILINYMNGNVSSVNYNGKTINYQYNTDNVKTLSKVTRPDGKHWSFYSEKTNGKPGNRFWNKASRGYLENYPMGTDCLKGGFAIEPYIKITHPDGASGEFFISQEYHGRTEVPKMPRDNPHRWNQKLVGYHVPKCVSTYSLRKKTLDINGEELEWLYDYSSNDGAFKGKNKQLAYGINTMALDYTDLGDLKITEVTKPDGSFERLFFNRRWGWEHNQQVFKDVYNSNGELLSRTRSDVVKGQHIGISMLKYDDASSSKILKKTDSVTLYNDAVEIGKYTTSYTKFNQYDEPEIHKQVNNLNDSIWYKKLYHHNTAINLLNVPAGVMVSRDGVNWKEANRQEFYTSGNGIGQVYRSWIAGKHISTNTYHTDGNLLQTSYNGSNRYEKFENYYRGKARKITLPCATTNGCTTVNGSTANTMVALLEVNADGTTKSVTDFNGNKASYSYNPIGWLTKIDYADPKWADKVISYATVTTANDGISGSAIAAGSLRQSISQGNYEKRVYHDALLRPVFTRERDIANGATTRYQAFEYDHENRQTLASFPSSNAASRVGMATEYDALGRIVTQTRTSDNSSSSRDYLAGNKVAVTDSEGNTTTTTYLAYGQPTYDKPLLIEAPNTDDISLDYNEFAQVTSIRQGNITEKRLYDNYQQLCKSVRPETGITAYGYNAQRQQIWRALGTNGSSTSCDAASVPASHKTLLGYDNLGQLRTENFPDTTPDRTYSYDANGNLRALTAGNISWSYLYNSQNAIDKETLSLDGKSFVLDWEYNNLGAVSSLKYPSGALVDFAPNALGQATKAGNYVTGVSYHPNGQVKQFTFGNGIVRNVEMDTSGRIDLLTDSKSGVIKNKLDPSYDGNDNLVRLIDWVDRNNDIDNLVYDGVDRLLSADGRWGTGRYTYDGMGNILSRTLNNVNIGYSYNNLNQLSKLSGAYAYGYQYDTRGNVIHNGRYPLSYNLGQQMVSAKGINYSYDGHSRRVRKTESGKNSYSVYSQGGQLLHRVSENGMKTDSIYLGKTIVAEVDGAIAANEVLAEPKVTIYIEKMYSSSDCSERFCTSDLGNQEYAVTWESALASECHGSVMNGSGATVSSLSGLRGWKLYPINDSYTVTLTCSGAGGSVTVSKSTDSAQSGPEFHPM